MISHPSSIPNQQNGYVAKALAQNPALRWPVWRPDLPAQDLSMLARAARQTDNAEQASLGASSSKATKRSGP